MRLISKFKCSMYLPYAGATEKHGREVQPGKAVIVPAMRYFNANLQADLVADKITLEFEKNDEAFLKLATVDADNIRTHYETAVTAKAQEIVAAKVVAPVPENNDVINSKATIAHEIKPENIAVADDVVDVDDTQVVTDDGTPDLSSLNKPKRGRPAKKVE